MNPPNQSIPSRAGLAYGVGAFGWWGFGFAVYLVLLNRTVEPDYGGHMLWPLETLAHRVIWSMLVCLLLVRLRRSTGDLLKLIRSPKAWGLLSGTALLITANWGCFIYGTATGRLSEASLGYFINPILSVFLGMIFLGERLRGAQWVSLGIATLGVGYAVLVAGVFPWIALTVATSFGLYSLLRKRFPVGPIVGLTLETAVILPVALGFLVVAELNTPSMAFARQGWGVTLMLMGMGIASVLPLVWFAAAAERLRLSTIAFLQFFAPTGQFVVAVLMNGETITRDRLVVFLLIWLGVAVFVYDALHERRKQGQINAACGP